ncbi:unnamed protein product [Mycena citricolor]|uniref:Uncharacterized protein n=1 Tax=Mycena citricolor TaxID=2018698 RepID=A0AAD2HD96_9AGAR|nr:unnamed protein product [Mycena citricolor]
MKGKLCSAERHLFVIAPHHHCSILFPPEPRLCDRQMSVLWSHCFVLPKCRNVTCFVGMMSFTRRTG